jgi:hypothetical protein
MKPKTVWRVASGLNAAPNTQKLCYGIPVGVKIMTSEGEIPSEFVCPGDKVVTRNGGLISVDAVVAGTYSTRAIRISEGCFGKAGPAEDVVVPIDQPVLVRDWRARAMFGQSQAMTTAGQLVDGEFITDIGPRRMRLVRFSFDRPRVIYAGGLELGSVGEVSLPVRAVA